MSHVQDRWMEIGPNGRKVRSARWGKGLRWRARWIEQGQERSKAFPSRDAAEYHLAQMAVSPARTKPRLTVREYAALWQAEQLHYATQSRSSVADRMRTMILPHLGDLDLASVTRTDVQRAVMRWTQSYAPATIHQAYSFLTTMFAAAVRDGWAPASPCVDVNLPPVVRKRITPLTEAQVAEIADRVPPWYWSMVIVGAATGMRGGELRGLEVDRILSGDVLVDRQLVGVRNGQPVFEPPKSDAGFRRISLGSVAEAALAEHLARWPSTGLVWMTRQHNPIRRSAAERVWRQATEGMAVRPRSGWHDLRHYHASILIAGGMSPTAVAERLGHADRAEALRTYAHLWPADHERMAAVADAALTGIVGPSGAVTYLPRRAV